MSALDLGYGVGCAVGPLLGCMSMWYTWQGGIFTDNDHPYKALLMDPVKHCPGMFSTTNWLKDFLVKYPYMLPCFASSCSSIMVAIFTFTILQETVPSWKPKTYVSMQHHMFGKKADYKTFENRISPPLKDEQTHRNAYRTFRSIRESLTRPILLGINMKCLTGFYSLYYQSSVLHQMSLVIANESTIL